MGAGPPAVTLTLLPLRVLHSEQSLEVLQVASLQDISADVASVSTVHTITGVYSGVGALPQQQGLGQGQGQGRLVQWRMQCSSSQYSLVHC